VVSGSKKPKEATEMVRNRAMCVVAVLALVMVGVGVSALAGYCYVGQSSGWLDGPGDYDLIRLGLRGGSYLLTVTVPWNADFDVMILDSDGNIVARSSAGGHGVTERVPFTTLFGGTYYAVVYSYSGSGSWTATLSRSCS
jgi:hypothetical protein